MATTLYRTQPCQPLLLSYFPCLQESSHSDLVLLKIDQVLSSPRTFVLVISSAWNDLLPDLYIPAASSFWQRRQWHPTPVLLPGKSHGWRSLEGCSPWGRWGSDTTEGLHFHFSLSCIGEGNWQPTPVFLPGESQGRGSLVGCRLWGRRVRHDWSDLAAAASFWW